MYFWKCLFFWFFFTETSWCLSYTYAYAHVRIPYTTSTQTGDFNQVFICLFQIRKDSCKGIERHVRFFHRRVGRDFLEFGICNIDFGTVEFPILGITHIYFFLKKRMTPLQLKYLVINERDALLKWFNLFCKSRSFCFHKVSLIKGECLKTPL